MSLETKAENFQIQDVDGNIITLSGTSDYSTREEAVAVATKLSKDYQIPLTVKQTV